MGSGRPVDPGSADRATWPLRPHARAQSTPDARRVAYQQLWCDEIFHTGDPLTQEIPADSIGGFTYTGGQLQLADLAEHGVRYTGLAAIEFWPRWWRYAPGWGR